LPPNVEVIAVKAENLVLFALFAASGVARADVVAMIETKDLSTDPPQVESQQMFIGVDRFRASGSTQATGPVVTIYRADKNLIWILDEEHKTYMELDKQTMHMMVAKLDEAMDQMDKALEQLSPEQRKAAEEIVKGKAPAAAEAAAPSIEFKSTGAKQTINGHPCTRYDCNIDGKKTSEVWVTSWGEAGVTQETLAVFKNLAGFFDQTLESSPLLREQMNQSVAMLGEIEKLKGFPILVRTFEDGKATQETLFKSIEPQKVDPSLYEVPAGFTQKQGFGKD